MARQLTKPEDQDEQNRAARNRLMVREGRCADGYLVVAKAVKATPLTQPLPAWIPIGELPVVDKEDWSQFGGGFMQAIPDPLESLTLLDESDLIALGQDEPGLVDLTEDTADMVQ